MLSDSRNEKDVNNRDESGPTLDALGDSYQPFVRTSLSIGLGNESHQHAHLAEENGSDDIGLSNSIEVKHQTNAEEFDILLQEVEYSDNHIHIVSRFLSTFLTRFIVLSDEVVDLGLDSRYFSLVLVEIVDLMERRHDNQNEDILPERNLSKVYRLRLAVDFLVPRWERGMLLCALVSERLPGHRLNVVKRILMAPRQAQPSNVIHLDRVLDEHVILQSEEVLPEDLQSQENYQEDGRLSVESLVGRVNHEGTDVNQVWKQVDVLLSKDEKRKQNEELNISKDVEGELP